VSAGVLAAALVAGALVAVRRAVRRGRRTGAIRDLVAVAPVVRHPSPPPAWFAERLTALDLGLRPDLVWHGWLIIGVTVPIGLLWAAGPGLAGLAAVVVTVGPIVGWRANRGRAEARLQAGLPAALEAVARSLRSGAALRGAVAEAGAATPGPLGADLRGVVRAAQAGGIVAALDAWAERRPLPGVRLAVAALCLGTETGGAQARAIDGVAGTLRQRLATAAEARALASQARASAAVIALAPLAFCGLTSATDPRVAAFLFRSGAGVVVLTAGLLLDTAGALWMARLTRPGP
jgi:tight adherence protein B